MSDEHKRLDPKQVAELDQIIVGSRDWAIATVALLLHAAVDGWEAAGCSKADIEKRGQATFAALRILDVPVSEVVEMSNKVKLVFDDGSQT